MRLHRFEDGGLTPAQTMAANLMLMDAVASQANPDGPEEWEVDYEATLTRFCDEWAAVWKLSEQTERKAAYAAFKTKWGIVG